MIDLIWPLLDINFSLKHAKKFVLGYMVAALFLSCFYSANMSAQFLFTKETGFLESFFKDNYKILVTTLSILDIFMSILPENAREGFKKMGNFDKAKDAFYTNKTYVFPENVIDKLEHMADKKLTLVGGQASVYLFASLVNIFEMINKAVLEEEYLFERLYLPAEIIETHKNMYRFWGINSETYRHLVEAGFVTQTFISTKLALRHNVKWSVVSNHLGKPGPLKTDSALGCVFIVELATFCIALMYIVERFYDKIYI